MQKGETMNDLISKQMLLEYIHGEPVGRLLCDKYNLDGLIKQFPSAQPYTDEEIQKMQDIEQAQFYRIHDLAYQEGKADAMRWISCADRFPEYGEAVLTINEDEDYEINHIIDEDNGEWFYEGAIAWMPLPKPPKER
jgi:hypothetical protein